MVQYMSFYTDVAEKRDKKESINTKFLKKFLVLKKMSSSKVVALRILFLLAFPVASVLQFFRQSLLALPSMLHYEELSVDNNFL